MRVCVCMRVSACVRMHACVCQRVSCSEWLHQRYTSVTTAALLFLCLHSQTWKEDDEDRKTRMTLKALRYPKKRTMHVSCPYCVRIFPSPQARDGHLQSHAESRPELNKYTCDVCELTFPRFMSMQQHRMTHKGVVKNRCARCAFESGDQTLLSKHWKSCQ